jgi:hypothetical protein
MQRRQSMNSWRLTLEVNSSFGVVLAKEKPRFYASS